MTSERYRSIPNRDPFAVDPLPKAHYHPSRQKNLSEDERQIAISPRRKDKKKSDHLDRPLSPADELFLKGGGTVMTGNPWDQTLGEETNFDESWPSTERPSSVGVPDVSDTSPFSLTKILRGQSQTSRFADLKTALDFNTTEEKEDVKRGDRTGENDASTLQRYIERFRKGAPMSKEERQRNRTSDKKDFWWITEANSSSEKAKDRQGGLSTAQLAEFSKQFEREKNVIPPPSPVDERTRRLQERADKLLEKSVSSVASSDPIVSTDGLGSTLGSIDSPRGTVSSYDEQPYRPVFAREDMSRLPERGPASKPYVPYQRIKKPSRPEEDILYQWRIKRRLEIARSTADKTPTANKFGFLSKTKEEREVDSKVEQYTKRLSGDPTPLVTNSTVHFTPAPAQISGIFQTRREQQVMNEPLEGCHLPKNDDTASEYPKIASPHLKRPNKEEPESHLHLVCDLLPCPHQEQLSSVQKRLFKEESQKKVSGNGMRKGGRDRDEGLSSGLDRQKRERKYREMEDSDGTGSDNLRFCERITEEKKEKYISDRRYEFLEAERPDEGQKEELENKERQKSVERKVDSHIRWREESRKKKEEFCDSDDNHSEKSAKSQRSSRSERSSHSMNSGRSQRSSASEMNSKGHKIEKEISAKSKTDENKNVSKNLPSKEISKIEKTQKGVRTSQSDKNVIGQRSSKPERSKSPISQASSKPMESAIGQVIRDRLFTSSVDTVVTSFDTVSSLDQSQLLEESCDTLPPKLAASPMRSTRGHEKDASKNQDNGKRKSLPQAEKEDEMYESDGEFEEDQLLVMLRKQRAQYELQLSEIDQILSSMET